MGAQRMPLPTTRVSWDGRDDLIEYAWIDGPRGEPLLVFLHEGLGSVAMWRRFPAALCAAAGCRGLMMSRPGYGGSTPRAPGERWPLDYLDRQAHDFLPAFLAAVGHDSADDPPWFYGHSDGASIALMHAAAFPGRVAGLVAAAPHLFVEALTLEGLAKARRAYEELDLRQRLAAYHADPDSPFWGWQDVWLDPAFRDWNIEARLPDIRCPVLAVQGRGDEYGTLAQVERIAEAVPGAQLLVLDDCGHTPHRDQPAWLTDAIVRFMQRGPATGA